MLVQKLLVEYVVLNGGCLLDEEFDSVISLLIKEVQFAAFEKVDDAIDVVYHLIVPKAGGEFKGLLLFHELEVTRYLLALLELLLHFFVEPFIDSVVKRESQILVILLRHHVILDQLF